jgi:probable F420-dependent oxidoreductase
VKFGLFFANAGPFSIPDTFEALCRNADETGFESLWTVEHVVVPVGYQSKYPYSEDGKMPGPENSPIPDPVVALSYAAAITKQIKLATGIVILPQRHPIYVAKEFASLDVLSRGRAILGVGIGWLEEEFNAVGVSFKDRVAITEESCRAIRSLWGEKAEGFSGDYYRWAPVESNPKPVQKSGVPIVVGGHVEGAARRAARVGDGWFPAKGGLSSLPPLIEAMHDECKKVGRKPDEIEVSAVGQNLDPDTVKRYEDIGVSRLIVPPMAFDPDGLKKGLSEFADRLIA